MAHLVEAADNPSIASGDRAAARSAISTALNDSNLQAAPASRPVAPPHRPVPRTEDQVKVEPTGERPIVGAGRLDPGQGSVVVNSGDGGKDLAAHIAAARPDIRD